MEEKEKPEYSDVLVPPNLMVCPEDDGQTELFHEGIVILLTGKGRKQIDIAQLTVLKLM